MRALQWPHDATRPQPANLQRATGTEAQPSLPRHGVAVAPAATATPTATTTTAASPAITLLLPNRYDSGGGGRW